MKHFLHKFIHIPKYKYGSRAIMRWLWKAWCGNRKQALLNALVGLVSVAVSLLQVAAFKYAIDVASGVIQGNLYLAIGYISLLVLAGFGLNISSVWIKNILGIKAQNRMQQKMLERILRSEWRGRERMHSGDVLNRLEFDVNNVVVFLTETIPSAISNPKAPVGIASIFIAWNSPSFITDPLPNCFSICPIAASNALFFSGF